MTEDDYNRFVNRLFKRMGSPSADLMHAAVGISGEAGEIIDAIKKVWVYNKPLDDRVRVSLKEELGDLLFYVHVILFQYGWTLHEIRRSNVDKLMLRYPHGYSDEAARDRADKEPE